MGKKLRRLFPIFFIPLFALLALAMRPDVGVAQTTLSPGDIMLVTVNSDDDDNFDFVPLVDLDAGTVIKFTDNAWIDGSPGSFENNEGIITYTASSSISSGTVVSYSGSDGNGFVSTSGSFNASGSGDNIIVYQGTESSPNFLYGAGFARGSSVWTYSTTSSTNRSDIPPGLSEAANTILFLGTTDNLQYDTSNGTEGTANSLLALIGDETNWAENDDTAFPALNVNFTLIDPPTIAFTTSSATVAEDGGSATLTVELVEASGDAVNIDVALLSGPSTAGASDIGNYTTQTVNFTSGDASGETRDVTITLTDDDNFEGDEIAVFQLQNNDAGSIIEPDILNLTITDDDVPDVVINEIHYDPAADANGDSNPPDSDDEFVELVNNSGSDLDISNWTLSDGAGVKYRFPSGTVIPANSGFVVFAAPAEGTSFGAAYLFSAGSLGLNNGNDDVTLMDADGTTITSVSYGDTGEPDASGESITRNPDITGSFEAHTTADSGGDSSPFSPGTQIDGTPFGNATYAIGIRGVEGWRFVGTPTESTTFDDLFNTLWTQGLTGSDAPSAGTNIFSWQQGGGGTFSPATDMNTNLTPGQGYIVFVYEDDDFRTPGVQGGFPKIISTDDTENASPVSVPVSANDNNTSGDIDGDEGYNLLSNPYGTDVSVAAVIDALEAADPSATVNANISVWDPNAGSGNGGYEPLTDGDQLAPFQAFFARYTTDGVSANASFDRSELAGNQGAPFFGQPDNTQTIVNFEMYMGNGNKFDTYRVEFNESGTIGEDRYDAYKLFSLNPNSINFFSTVGNDVRLAKNALPPVNVFEEGGELRIPFSYAIPRSGEYTFSWSDLSEIPEQLELFILDNQTGRKINIRSQQELKVDLSVETEQQPSVNKISSPTLSKTETSEDSPRFELLIVAAEDEIVEPEPLQEPVVLSPNYPNPFNQSGTTIDIQVREKMEVKMTVWNIVGQKVGTMVENEIMEPNRTYSPTWNVPANMPSGIYICKVEAGGMVMTRKMTLVK